MEQRYRLILSILLPTLALVLLFLSFCCYIRQWVLPRPRTRSPASGEPASVVAETEELIRFAGGEELTVHDILDAPGEVVGKSCYATLYRAYLQRSGALALLRFVRPACVARAKDIVPAVRMLGDVGHPNLVPLRAMYVGPRGEKLFVHPYFAGGTLSQLLQDRKASSYSWEVIYTVSIGIARGLDHLHMGLQKPIVHGNLKSNNILLDRGLQARVSDFGTYLLLNPSTAQEVLETSAAQGYKAPELIKMRDVTRETDIYSLGVLFLEMLTRKEPMDISFLHSKDIHLPTSIRNLILEHKISSAFSPDLLGQDNKKQNAVNEDDLLMYFQLAMSCCSPSPALRPDIKYVLSRLEEIGTS